MTRKRLVCSWRVLAFGLLFCAVELDRARAGITIRVPADYATITGAINHVTHGDEIIVSPQVYVENIHFGGKNIVLRSTDPTNPAAVAATIIDGNQAGSVVTFAGTEAGSCVLSGFTIRNGRAVDKGGGICGNGASATVEYCLITGNSAGERGSNVGKGGAIYQCHGLIRCNTISTNTVWGWFVHYGSGAGIPYSGLGGGLYDCDGLIQNNIVAGNRADMGDGGGLYGCDGTIQNSVICRNSAKGDYPYLRTKGGGLNGCLGTIRNCIIWGNSASYPYSGVQLHNCSTPSYSCVQGWANGDEGNIGNDPQFVDEMVGDFHLLRGSPCIDAGTSDGAPTTDKDGNPRPFDGDGDGVAVCDMGAYEFMSLPDTRFGDPQGLRIAAGASELWRYCIHDYSTSLFEDVPQNIGPATINVSLPYDHWIGVFLYSCDTANWEKVILYLKVDW